MHAMHQSVVCGLFFLQLLYFLSYRSIVLYLETGVSSQTALLLPVFITSLVAVHVVLIHI